MPLTGTTHPSLSRASSRVTGLDAARVLATLGIVWVHVAEIQGQPEAYCSLGRFGTSFYTLAALFLSSRAGVLLKAARPGDIIRRRAKRLLVPFVVWSALYAAFYFITMYPQGYPVAVITRYWGPLFGTAPHLWFLPFAFVAGAVASYAVPRMMKWSGVALSVGGTLVTLAVYVYVYRWGFAALDQPAISAVRLHRLGRWVEEAPLVCGALFGLSLYGKYIGRLARFGRRSRMRLSWCAFSGFVLVQFAYAMFLDELGSMFWNHVRFLANLAGATWLITFVAARDGRWIRQVAPLGKATYFAYLSHQMILDAVKRLLTFLPGHGSLLFALLSTALIYLSAVGLGVLVTRVRLLRWLSP
jgi:fucose 4-O-acetylase-like acetyltransferase